MLIVLLNMNYSYTADEVLYVSELFIIIIVHSVLDRTLQLSWDIILFLSIDFSSKTFATK